MLETAPKALFAILAIDAFRDAWIGDEANITIYESVKFDLLKTANAKEILEMEDIDGALVGGASLKNDFVAIVNYIKSLYN